MDIIGLVEIIVAIVGVILATATSSWVFFTLKERYIKRMLEHTRRLAEETIHER